MITNNFFTILPCYDPDVKSWFEIPDFSDVNLADFLTATGLSYGQCKRVVCDYVTANKDFGTWDKAQAQHIYMGTTASQHKWNIKDQRDLDAAFRLSFFGGWSHSANGALPNKINAYSNSHFIPSVNATINGFNFGIYSRTNDTTGTQVYGCATAGAAIIAHQNLSTANMIIGPVGAIVNYTANPSTRFMMARRSSLTALQGYRDGVSLGTSAVAGSLSTVDFYFGARNNNGTPLLFTGHELAFGFLSGSNMTNTDALNFRTTVDALQLAFGRNV